MNTGPIFIVDDDLDDQLFIKDVIQELMCENEIKAFYNAEQVIEELKNKSSIPFIVISDVNLPKMDGFELRKILNEDNSIGCKAIPFIFWSNYASDKQIQKAYDLGGHGFFIKEDSLKESKEMMKDIIKYWMRSKVPDKSKAQG